MAKIAFVTDSTAYIPANLVQKHNIIVAPQVLIWGGQTFQDGVDIQPNEFYTRLKTSKTMPTTSQVSVVSFQNIFQNLLDKDFSVVGVFISGKLSGTLQSATQAREALGTAAEKVVLVDSNTTAMAMGFQILHAVRAAENGASLEDCKALVEKA
jgi:DegV family protein with EDD domain